MKKRNGIKILTVDSVTFASKLLQELPTMSNSEISRKLDGWGKNSPWSATTLIEHMQLVDQMTESFWMTHAKDLVETIVREMDHLVGREIVESVLVYQIHMLMNFPNPIEKAIIRVSKPAIVMALAANREQGEYLKKKFDIELGRER